MFFDLVDGALRKYEKDFIHKNTVVSVGIFVGVSVIYVRCGSYLGRG